MHHKDSQTHPAGVVLDQDPADLTEAHDRPEVQRPCWNCGGPGVRCCEFAADV